MIVGPNKFAHNVNNMMIMAVGRRGTDNVAIVEVRGMPKCHLVCGSFDSLWPVRGIDVVSALYRIGDKLCKVYNIGLGLM